MKSIVAFLAIIGVVACVPTLGGYRDVDITSEDLVPFVSLAVHHENINSNSDVQKKMVTLDRIQQQVVAGFNYKINYKVQPTYCTKANVYVNDLHACQVNEQTPKESCETVVFHGLDENTGPEVSDHRCDVST